MYPDPLPRHAHEPSVWAKTKQETYKRQHCSNARWDTGNTEKTRAHREDYGETTGYGRKYRRRRLGQWGEVDEDDEYNGDEYVAKEGPADGKRLVWSYRWVSIPLPLGYQIQAIPFYHKIENQGRCCTRYNNEHTDSEACWKAVDATAARQVRRDDGLSDVSEHTAWLHPQAPQNNARNQNTANKTRTTQWINLNKIN